jgi:2-oxoglutarate dehydrogenase E1 component
LIQARVPFRLETDYFDLPFFSARCYRERLVLAVDSFHQKLFENFHFLKSVNAEYIDEQFQKFKTDPLTVEDSWRAFFEGIQYGQLETLSQVQEMLPLLEESQLGVAGDSQGIVSLRLEAAVSELISAYRSSGLLIADLNPLEKPLASHPLLDLSGFGLTNEDLSTKFEAGRMLGFQSAVSLGEILSHLKETYCGSVGVEFSHINDKEILGWLTQKMESSRNKEDLSREDRNFILKRLTQSEIWETFLNSRYVAQKRFSLEGGEALIPLLDRTIEIAGNLGANNVVVGMAHRGRLNVLTNIFGKKPELIFSEFEEAFLQNEGADSQGMGDVKYHMGFSADVTTRQGNKLHLSLAHNPSHLEFIGPVVEGMTRSKQRALKDKERTQVIPIVIHGDASFAGQGVCYETINFSQVSGYKTGGTVHIVVNNQVGFTTDPESGRSTKYATDLAKMLDVPIFHVNGENPEAVFYCAKIAMEFRQKFKKDVFIDLICYRKYGHNEGDEPAFTQPNMYKTIRAKKTVRALYAERLESLGLASANDAKQWVDLSTETLSQAQQITRTEKPKPITSTFDGKWKGLRSAREGDVFTQVETSVAESTLKKLSDKINKFPAGFKLHPKLERFFETRKQAVESGQGIDWGNAESLAYASLLAEGHPIRITGQDTERGTFTHRHGVVRDFETGEKYTPHNNLGLENAGDFIIRNSTLSETAVLGFEYGWSLADPMALVIWEAQFGDFANGAQVIIDQFISSSEIKWQRYCGLVLFLPHGFEGQGPEHSSARLERFLQLCGDNNMVVANFTTPAQLFHALRRQLKRDFRKPMVVMTPKSLLRHPLAVSSLADLSTGHFEPVLDDPIWKTQDKRDSVKKIILCSGKIYYELAAARESQNKKDTAIIRIEELYPWPEKVLAETILKYPKANEIFWVQEEPRNQGAWTYVFCQWMGGYSEFFKNVGNRTIRFIGRKVSAAPTTGSHKAHVRIQNEIVTKAISI